MMIYEIIHQILEIYCWIIGPRIRCPNCGMIGFWQPYGGWISIFLGGDQRHVRRYICKWCGDYKDNEIGHSKCYIVPNRPWTLIRDLSEEEMKIKKTPEMIYVFGAEEWPTDDKRKALEIP